MTGLVTILAQESGGDSGNFLVTPNVGVMIWTLIAFGLTLYVLRRLAFPRIAEALGKRPRASEGSIEGARRTRTATNKLLAEYRDRLAAARHQAEEIVSRARKAA